jgi:hypothetical protein
VALGAATAEAREAALDAAALGAVEASLHAETAKPARASTTPVAVFELRKRRDSIIGESSGIGRSRA